MAGDDYVREFNSLTEWVEYCDGPSDLDTRQRESRNEGRDSFHATESWDAAKAIAFRWDEGAKAVEALSAKIGVGVTRLRKEAYRSATLPGAVNMGAVVAGHPKPVVARRDSKQTQKGRGKVMRIVVNVSASGIVGKEVLQRKGAIALALAEAFEKKGVRTEIIATFAVRGGEDYLRYRIKVKRASERLNLHSIAFALSNPDMLRRMVFSAMERENATLRKKFGIPHGGYGMPADEEKAKQGDVYLPAAKGWESQWESDHGAVQWVHTYLKDNGWIK